MKLTEEEMKLRDRIAIELFVRNIQSIGDRAENFAACCLSNSNDFIDAKRHVDETNESDDPWEEPLPAQPPTTIGGPPENHEELGIPADAQCLYRGNKLIGWIEPTKTWTPPIAAAFRPFGIEDEAPEVETESTSERDHLSDQIVALKVEHKEKVDALESALKGTRQALNEERALHDKTNERLEQSIHGLRGNPTAHQLSMARSEIARLTTELAKLRSENARLIVENERLSEDDDSISY